MEAIDDSLVTDERDVINSVAFEKMARRAYGLERAHEDCSTELDWKRPDNAKNWRSKVKWDLCDRYDVRGQNMRTARVREADKEVQDSLENDVAFTQYYTKYADATKSSRE